MTVPRHCQKTNEWMIPQLLEWSSHALAYEISQLTKTNHTTFHGHPYTFCDGTYSVDCASLWIRKNPPLIYCCVSLNSFCSETSRTWASLGPETRHHGFWPVSRGFLVAQMAKHLSAMLETPVQSLGQEDPLEKKMATHSSTLAWKVPWTKEPCRLQSMGLQRVRHDWVTLLTLLSLSWTRLSD